MPRSRLPRALPGKRETLSKGRGRARVSAREREIKEREKRESGHKEAPHGAHATHAHARGAPSPKPLKRARIPLNVLVRARAIRGRDCLFFVSSSIPPHRSRECEEKSHTSSVYFFDRPRTHARHLRSSTHHRSPRYISLCPPPVDLSSLHR